MWDIKFVIILVITGATGIVRFKKKFGSHSRKIFNRFTRKDSYTWNMTHNMESIAV
jgi:hypothetical protein